MLKSYLKFFTLVLIVFLFLSGCANPAEKAVEKESRGKVNIDTDKGKVKIETEHGKPEIEAGSKIDLPQGFPESFPIYEDSKAVSVVKSTNQGKDGYMVIFETRDDVKSVADWYEEELRKTGYEVNFSLQQEDFESFAFKNKTENINGSVQVQKSNGITQIVVFIVY